MSHALLSPSGASRWIACTPSARLEQQFPDKGSSYALEGSLAHAVAEVVLREKASLIAWEDFLKAFVEFEANPIYNAAMCDHAVEYAVFVMERYHEAKSCTPSATLVVEQKLDLTEYIPESFGTGDAIIIADGVMDVIDLKYGQGVSVSAENNKQMMLYGLGALKEFEFMYDIHTVRMTIYQPRIGNYSSWDMPVEDLLRWADQELRPRAEIAFRGEGEFVPGSHCVFCKAKAVCKANAQKQLEIAQYEFAEAILLTDEEIADILTRADMFAKWLSAVQEHALTEAVSKGKKWPGYKLVEGRSVRQYSDQVAVAKKLTESGISEALIYEKKLLGISAMEKTITKKQFNTLLADLVIKPAGKPTLAPESDKRAEWQPGDSAADDFKTECEE